MWRSSLPVNQKFLTALYSAFVIISKILSRSFEMSVLSKHCCVHSKYAFSCRWDWLLLSKSLHFFTVARIRPLPQRQIVVMVLLSICSPSYYQLSYSYYLVPLVQRSCDPLHKWKLKDVFFFITRFTHFTGVETVIGPSFYLLLMYKLRDSVIHFHECSHRMT